MDLVDKVVDYAESFEDEELIEQVSFNRAEDDEREETYVDVRCCDVVDFDDFSLQFFEKFLRHFPRISHPIYSSMMLTQLLNYKWHQLKKYHTRSLVYWLTFILFYLTYTMSIFGYKIEDGSTVYRTAAIVLELILLLMCFPLFLFEVLQMRYTHSFQFYLSNRWNLVDLLATTLGKELNRRWVWID